MARTTWLRTVAVVAALCAGACSDGAGSGSATSSPVIVTDPTAIDETVAATVPGTVDATTGIGGEPGRGVLPEGFTTVTARITEADGGICEVCLWLADTTDERNRGLMGVTDLGDAVGMAFAFDEPIGSSFYMYRTPTPLSIAWFAPDGSLAGTADMAPCLDTPAEECPSYAPEATYDLAIEVFDDGTGGGLAALGIGPGARAELVPGTEGEECAVADGVRRVSE